MKTGLYLVAVLGLAALWVGCQKTEPAASNPSKEMGQGSSPTADDAASTDAASTELTLVKLKVPNMT
ncbi:MAG: hypothetical protein ACYC6N_04255 [Pirellulaceae bacterium]